MGDFVWSLNNSKNLPSLRRWIHNAYAPKNYEDGDYGHDSDLLIHLTHVIKSNKEAKSQRLSMKKP